jgi:hypothetical protein
MFIYVITNNITGKIYIGQHKGANLKQYLQKKFYWSRVQKTGSSYLYNSMRKHPDYKDWSIEPLMEFDTKEELDLWETRLIALYDTRNPEVGYNICKGGEGRTGPQSEEAKRKIGLAAKKAWTSPEYRANFTVKTLGHAVSDKVIAELKSRTVSKASAETKLKLSESHKGKVHSEGTRNKMSASHMGHGTSLETRTKLSKSKLGNRNPMKTPETSKRVSIALTGRVQPAAVNEKRAATMREVWATKKIRPIFNPSVGS